MGLELKLRALLKLNYKFFADMTFLREGGYSNVASGQTFYDGGVTSVFLPDLEAPDYYGMSAGQVWQSPFRQFIYESGVVLDGLITQAVPTIMSGVYVNGSFRAQDDSTYSHHIDFLQGRIFFDSPLPLDTQVHADFAYRHVRVDFEHAFNQQFSDGYIESKYATNPETSFQLVYPSGNKQPFPAVFIEIDRRSTKPYELGNRSLTITDEVKFHIWALDDLQRDNIVDILSSQENKTIPLIDFNKMPMPLSGIFNELSPEYVPYQLLLKNNLIVTTIGSGTPVMALTYIDKVMTENVPGNQEYERALVTYYVTTYFNFPVSPIGYSYGSIGVIPKIGDPAF